MDLPAEFYEMIIMLILVSVAMALVHYFTRHGRNFRSSRNRKARKQF